LVALVIAVLVTATITALTYRSLQSRESTANAVVRATDARNLVNRIQVELEQAQGGQRGFLLTGDPDFLRNTELAKATLPAQFVQLRRLEHEESAALREIETLDSLITARLGVIDQTIALARDGKQEEAREIVRTGRGRAAMDEARTTSERILASIETDLARENAAWADAVTWSGYVTYGGSAVIVTMLLLVGLLASRDYRAVAFDTWIRRIQLDLGTLLQADERLEVVGSNVLDVFVPNLDAQVGVVYITEPDGLRRIAAHAVPAETPMHIARGEGLAGQAALEERVIHLDDVPESYLPISSAVGRTAPRQVLIIPAIADGTVQAVIELGFLRELHANEIAGVARITETIANAIRSARDRSKLEELLEETQRQAEELQAQQEELRVTNEELEQQSRTLQLSQTQLENQQSELEQINAQLEEQTSSLERQRDELTHTGSELQRANEYKSQFLANMSHELRTPLNSSLILAKLLSDNREGNLNEEQINFARTIYSAGNDLLTLINDILDLSKIEAGMLDVRNEPVGIRRILEDLRSTFAPVAEQKQLALELVAEEDVPQTIETDQTRLQQVLRNLLSNALKFTERGGVTMTLSLQGEHVAFAVRDTGIGIAADQQETIFEPFRQADGATNRKFGGTGLGLSISRDLARLLGGDLRVDSAPGRGSTFTVTLPLRAPVRGDKPSTPSKPATPPAIRNHKPLAKTATATSIPPGPFEDDRDKVTASSRSILMVEDDVAFARVMFDLAHELDFQAVVATSGDDGLALARTLTPSAIVLDVSLPDRSGLAVLDALKRDPGTRHIPVHIVSAHDYTRTALAMGAAGYALKPVERDRLVDAIKRLEGRMTRGVRRVLVVEDDAVLRESTARLLSTDGVETVTADTTAKALELLRTTTFDCMVLDLALPDRSGLELLEEMSQQDQYSFPPVIVYTGRSLTSNEVHELERFSHSIIIKGARSPERLLDEVTLFLHQVESELPPERQRMLRDARDREAAFEGRKILIVEDDVRNVFALSAVLEPKGAKLVVARNGREALEQLRKAPDLDLVLMDIMMPEMDGYEAMREIRKEPRFAKLPIIALTAKAMADDREKCLAAGANDYISKPIDVDKLLSLARVWIRK
jgi:CheY-like chemotaxis protein/signal transduction histidine kinase/CHASE3 domain sensor protein